MKEKLPITVNLTSDLWRRLHEVSQERQVTKTVIIQAALTDFFKKVIAEPAPTLGL